MKKFLKIFKFIVHIVVSIFGYDENKPIEIKSKEPQTPLNTEKENNRTDVR